jgi:hypothetical protein
MWSSQGLASSLALQYRTGVKVTDIQGFIFNCKIVLAPGHGPMQRTLTEGEGSVRLASSLG